MYQSFDKQTHSAAGASARERRQHARYPFTATVEAVESVSQTKIQGRTSDLSQGGCYVDAISSFPAGSIIKMRLTKERAAFEVQAEVVYSLVGMGMGVKFMQAGPEHVGIVEKWLGELSGERAPEGDLPTPIRQSDTRQEPDSDEVEVANVLVDIVMELKGQGILSSAKSESLVQKLNCARRAKQDSTSLKSARKAVGAK